MSTLPDDFEYDLTILMREVGLIKNSLTLLECALSRVGHNLSLIMEQHKRAKGEIAARGRTNEQLRAEIMRLEEEVSQQFLAHRRTMDELQALRLAAEREGAGSE